MKNAVNMYNDIFYGKMLNYCLNQCKRKNKEFCSNNDCLKMFIEYCNKKNKFNHIEQIKLF